MARHSLASRHSQFRPAYSQRARARSRKPEISAALERKWFEFDRNVVTDVLNTLHRAIHNGAIQMEMIAAEQMFDAALSRTFARTSRRLSRTALKLKELGIEVNGVTGYPKP